MPLDEAARLAGVLTADTSSQTCAALNGWAHPISREALALLDVHDLTYLAHFDRKAFKPHAGRPFSMESGKKRRGDAAGRSRAEVVAILNAHGHNLN